MAVGSFVPARVGSCVPLDQIANSIRFDGAAASVASTRCPVVSRSIRMPVYTILVRSTALALIVAAASTAGAQSTDRALSRSGVLPAMRQELARSVGTLRAQATPPYFLSYDVTEVRSAGVHGAFGTITGASDERRRMLGVDLRVGTPAFDNTHEV